MTAAWAVVVIVGAATVAIKSVGSVLLGGRPLPPRVQSVVRLLAPAVLSALVATGVLATGQRLVVDARLLGSGRGGDGAARAGPVARGGCGAAAATAIARLAGFA